MSSSRVFCYGSMVLLLCAFALPAGAQSFKVQCPKTTPGHLTPAAPNTNPNGGQIKCQQISGGDGYATMGDGTQTYLFSFGPLSGLKKIVNGQPGTDTVSEFNVVSPSLLTSASDATPPPLPTWDGAVGLSPDPDATFTRFGATTQCTNAPSGNTGPNATPASCITGHVDPRQVMDVGVMNGNIPAPMMAIDEDDEFFLTLTNVGMIMRPDLFEQHTVHFHGYPNASSFYDGVPDASVAINIGGSFTYYYLAPDAGTYFWHCHITPPEHLQMGMVGQIFVRPRQNRVTSGTLRAGLLGQQSDPRTRSDCAHDILCTSPVPPVDNGVTAQEQQGGRADAVRLQRRRRLDRLRRRVSHSDPRLRSELPFRRHDLQSRAVHRHEGQVLPAERPQLSGHGDAGTDVDRVRGRRAALLAAAACDHQYSGRGPARCCAFPTST